MENLEARAHEIAEELDRTITDCINSEISHLYKAGKFDSTCSTQAHITEALVQFASEVSAETERRVREETIREVEKILDNYPDITVDDSVRLKNEVFALLPTPSANEVSPTSKASPKQEGKE